MENVTNLLTLKKFRKSTNNKRIYAEKLDLKMWNVFDFKVRTNNQAEGYNYALITMHGQ